MAEKTLAQYIKNLRKSYNYSQEFVASHLNITRQTYSHYETGRITPPANSLYNLAKLYGVPVETFMELAVTYQINMDFARPQIFSVHSNEEEMADYLAFINADENKRKYRYLSRKERLLLFYFSMLDFRDQDDILSFMKVKHQNRQNEIPGKTP